MNRLGTKTDRIDFRITPKDKRLLKKKAKTSGRSLSEFIIWKCKSKNTEIIPCIKEKDMWIL